MFDYLSDHPTSAEIQAAVYEVKPHARITNKTREEFERLFTKEVGMLPPDHSAPPGFKEDFEWAEEMKKKMGLPN